MNETLQKIVRRYLDTNNLTIAFLARKTNIDSSELSRWINGKRKLGTFKIQKIKNFLNGNFIIPVEEVINKHEETKQS